MIIDILARDLYQGPMQTTSKLLEIKHLRRHLPCLLMVCFWVGATGCNGHRPSFAPNLAANGSMKAALSQIQFENETLKAKLGKLEKQNRLLAADLQREEAYSGTLATRLDESRNLMKRNGLNVPTEEDSPRMVARADESRRSESNQTFGQVAGKRPRRSRYADEPADDTTKPADLRETADDSFPDNDSPKSLAKPKTINPPGFKDDPESLETEVPELSANDLSTGWRRLSYRSMMVGRPDPTNQR